jgi:hypothetical protein
MNKHLPVFLHRHTRHGRSRSRTLKQFASKLGLVYFGLVDQHVDEHDVIRGVTASTSHRDEHYAVGSYDGYGISVVDRSDIVGPSPNQTEQHWVILQIKLDQPTPKLFIKPMNHDSGEYDRLLDVNVDYKPLNEFFETRFSEEFLSRFVVYGAPGKIGEIEALLTPEFAQELAAHIWPQAIELSDQTLYAYISSKEPTDTEINTALVAALWLAHRLDGDD